MPEVLDIGSGKQLFVGPWANDGRDAHLVASMQNVEMTMHPARVTGERLVVNDRPWEGTGILDMRQFVLRDGERFRMYYSALPNHFVSDDPNDPRKNLWKRPHNRILCYAESDDGIHWTKPDLGLCEWRGSTRNNILIPNPGFPYAFSEVEGATVFVDPAASSPDEAYKMFVKISPVGEGGTEEKGATPYEPKESLPKGQYAFGSPDGIHWRLLSEKRVNAGPHADTQYSVFWDDRIGKYVQYSRYRKTSPEQIAYYRRTYPGAFRDDDANLIRKILFVGRAASDDFINWSEEELVFGPDEIDNANLPEGLNRLDFYGGNIAKYSEAPDVYIGLPNAYYHWKIDPTRKWWSGKYVELPATMDAQLITSRDGIHWNRTPRRKAFIPTGLEGSFWSKQIYPDGNAIRVGDELWFYFAGLDVGHKEQSLKESHGARSRAVLRLDGFISADAAYTGGELTSYPLVFTGDRLQLNVDTGAGGVAKVEIQDESGRPIEGYAEADSDEINGNYTHVVASWRGSPDVSSLASAPIRLRFVMRDTQLYSFQFVSAEDAAGASASGEGD